MKLRGLIIGSLFCALLTLSSCGGSTRSTLTGWYLETESGSALIVTEDGEPISMSDQSRGGKLFDGLDNGDRIEITHDAIAESYPGQASVFTCRKLEDGSFENIPAEAVAALEELGYTFDSHSHVPAKTPLPVDDPVSGYCGNTVTEVVWNSEAFSFWGTDSVTLTDILINLAYDPEQICRCLPEFTVNTEFGAGYGVNLSGAYARCEKGQAALTAEQVDKIREIIQENRT